MLWTPRLQTTVSYADSVGGNLGTELGTARMDYYGQSVHSDSAAPSAAPIRSWSIAAGTELADAYLREAFRILRESSRAPNS